VNKTHNNIGIIAGSYHVALKFVMGILKYL